MAQISVVIPTYRRKDLLLRCLEKLRAQDFPVADFEIIVVVDDGHEAHLEYEVFLRNLLPPQQNPLIRLLYSEKKCGPARARNIGWKNATGELILFTDDDTLPSSGWISAYWEAYAAAGNLRTAFTGSVKVPLSLSPTDYERSIAWMESASMVTANFCCPRFLLESEGGFDETFPLAWREDSEMEFRLMENGISIVRVEKACIEHPVRKARWGISLWLEKKNLVDPLLYRKHPILYRKRIRRYPVWRYYAMVFFSLAAVVFLLGGRPVYALALAGVWLLLVLSFAIRRLHHTSKSFSHITEMLVTSMLLPYLSLFWLWKGSMRYSVFML